MGAEIALCVILAIMVLRWTNTRHAEWERNQPRPNWPYDWQRDREVYYYLTSEEDHGNNNSSLEVS
jgi:hypothetical protein